MDGRHAFIIQKLADVIAVDKSVVEDYLAADENFSWMDEFFAENGARRLMFFYQDAKRQAFSGRADAGVERRMFITNGTSEALKGSCYVFLRTTPKAITANNIATEVTFQVIDAASGKLVDAFEKLVSQIILPLFRTYEVSFMRT